MNRRIQTCYLLSEQEKMLLQDAAKEPEPARPQLRVSAGLQPGSQPEKPAVQTLILSNPAPVPQKTEIPAAPAVLKPAAEIAEPAEKPAERAPKVTVPRPQSTAVRREPEQKKRISFGSLIMWAIVFAVCLLILLIDGDANGTTIPLLVFGIINLVILTLWFENKPVKLVAGAVYVIFLFMYGYVLKENDFHALKPPFELLYMAITLFPMLASLFGVFFDDEDHKKIGMGIYSALLIGAAALTSFAVGTIAFYVLCIVAAIGLLRALIKR